MTAKNRTIEVDGETASLLEARAAARGISVSELLADIAGSASLPGDLAALRARGEGPWSKQALDDDAQRLAEFERTRSGMPWDDVKAWMATWGTPQERPAPKSRKL
jgi:hypothetical protein